MTQASPIFQRILLVLSGVAALGAATWVGFRFFEPVVIPPTPPPRPPVRFNPEADIRNNPLFATLKAVFRGTVEPGALGKVNPFAPAGAILGSGNGTIPSSVGTIEEIKLNGEKAISLSPAKDGAMLVLVNTNGVSYEVRRYDTAQPFTTVARWTTSVPPGVAAVPEDFTPAAIQQDGFGGIRILSQGRYVGIIQADGVPSWASAPLFVASVPQGQRVEGDIALDGNGRLWVTDGWSVAHESDDGFTMLDLPSFLTAEQRQQIAGISPSPWQLAPTPDGGMVVFSAQFMLRFPLNATQPDRIIAVDGPILAVAPNGDVWWTEQRANAISWFRRTVSIVKTYTDPLVLPKDAPANPRLIAAGSGGLYSLDYRSDGTVLWTSPGSEDWVAEVLIPRGIQPQDTLARIEVDTQGHVWGILTQQGLLLARPMGR